MSIGKRKRTSFEVLSISVLMFYSAAFVYYTLQLV